MVHQMAMSGEGGSLWSNGATAMTRHAAVANPANGNSVQFTHNSNVTMNLTTSLGPKNFGAMALGQVGVMNKRTVTYVPAPGGTLPGIRILPWSATDVTFMALNGTADFALTGPLTGCTVAAVAHGGSIWFFHANVSGGGGVGPANRATKRQMIRQAGNLVGIPGTADYVFCQYGPDHDYNGQAFVWGRRRAGGNWKFYVHEVQPESGLFHTRRTVDGKWADI
ncbi:hypothetical protein [Belnapia moabensis]|uniref:hypothetical protein n=1 Tax=Belnapia moabensis TaxID=365533 RepID=UPI0005B988C5|nr:hypothetical protein [Belnapia moabensis]